MGLRERKAQRNRERIVREALVLFARDGYEQTTMESIAESAEISPSTLYRYFPSKDLIVLDRFTSYAEQFSRVFAEHSIQHPVEEALAEAIFTTLEVEDKKGVETLLVRSIIDKAPIARARLWDLVAEQQRQLCKLLAERLHARKDDLRVILTAQMAMMIAGIAADRWRDTGRKEPSRATAAELMRLLQQQAVVFPRPLAKSAGNARPVRKPAMRK